MRCNLAVSMRVVRPQEYTDPRDAISQSWMAFFERCDICPVLIPNRIDVQQFLARFTIDGILLTGGNDVCASTYGATHEDSSSAAPERDTTETVLIRYALDHDLPILGACRGMQMLNAYFGGKLLPQLQKQHPGGISHVVANHTVHVEAMWARERFGVTQLTVNSYHDQGISNNELADPLEVLARAEDGVIEAIAHRELDVYGIQWHPERPGDSAKFDEDLVRSIFISRDVRTHIGNA